MMAKANADMLTAKANAGASADNATQAREASKAASKMFAFHLSDIDAAGAVFGGASFAMSKIAQANAGAAIFGAASGIADV